MYLISWNVAGWSSTSQAIRESYGSLHDFFACTGADIICLQECKGTLAKLTATPVEMGASDPPPSRRPAVQPLARLAAVPRQNGASAGGSAAFATQTAAKALGSGKTPLGSSVSGVGGANDGIEGWESFWSFSGKQQRGFNGVVTFARKGLTWRCDSRPFAEEEFNEEGRVIVTHHSAFVLVNVYVPNARGGARHNYKFSFLRALELLMEKLRSETQKPVILVGDLNMTYRAFDGAWSLRRIHIGTLLQMEAFANEKTDAEWSAALPHLTKAALQRVVNMIANYFCARVIDIAGSLAEGSQSLKETSSASALLHSPLSPPSPAARTGVVSVDAELVVDGDTIDRAALQHLRDALQSDGCSGSGWSTGRMAQMYDAAPLSLRQLYEAGFRNAYASEFAKSFSCAHNNELYAVVRYCGLSPHSDASADFMSRLLHLPLPLSSTAVLASRLPWAASTPFPREEGDRRGADYAQTRMFDSFLLTKSVLDAQRSIGSRSDEEGGRAALEAALMREVERPQLQPYCPCPYTVWDQSRNRRLENVGTRLDYILVDAALLPAVMCRGETANNVSPATESTLAARSEFFSEVQGAQYRDGVLRTMAGGAYPPAPFDGSGMPALAEGARELCCAGLPATGLFVTPPQFSDHIGVGLLLDLGRLGGRSELAPRPGKVVEDHKCMYRPPVGLHTFFAAAAATKKPPPADAAPSLLFTPSSSPAGQKRAADEKANVVDGGNGQSHDSSNPSGGNASRESANPLKSARTETTKTPQPAKATDGVEVVDVDDL